MPRFRVRDLMISIGPDDDGPCWLITQCGGVTELCVENTQGCAFPRNCNCTLATACDQFTCGCTACTPCSQRTCICTGCTGRSLCNARSLCGATVACTPTFVQTRGGALRPEDLAELKQELRAALEEVEAEETRIAESERPQTLDEVTQLEGRLTEALVELQQRREELESRAQGEPE